MEGYNNCSLALAAVSLMLLAWGLRLALRAPVVVSYLKAGRLNVRPPEL